jgi:hypothetical protein
LDIVAFFAAQPDLCFRCVVVERQALGSVEHNDGDAELGFYKLYYQLLVHWFKAGNQYHVYLDWQQNKDGHRFATLRDILRRKLTGRAEIECLEPVESSEIPLLQLVDLAIGAVGYQWNGRHQSAAKSAVCNELARAIGKPNLVFTTPPGAEKFNVFHFTGRR